MPVVQRINIHPCLLCQIAKRNPVNFYATTSISRLFLLRNPSTILWAIVPVYLDSIQRKSWAPRRRHVIEEILKIRPSLTNHNSPATIVTPVLVPRVVATIAHPSPDFVKPVLAKTVFFVRLVIIARMTPTRRHLSFTLVAKKILSASHNLLTALTPTSPIPRTVRMVKTYDCQKANLLSRQVDSFDVTEFIHDLFPIPNNILCNTSASQIYLL